MTRLTRLCRTIGVGLAVTTATVAMTQVANAAPAPPAVPASLAPPVGNQVFLVGHAKGVQIYKCDGTSWIFVAPEATLTGGNGQVVATHSAGPIWKAPTAARLPVSRSPRILPVRFPLTRRTFSSFCCREHQPAQASSAQRPTFNGSTPRAGLNLPLPSARHKRQAR